MSRDRKLAKLRLEFVDELIVIWLVDRVRSCNPENMDPEDRVVDDSVASLEGKVTD